MNRKYFLRVLVTFVAMWKPIVHAFKFLEQGNDCRTGSDVQGPFYRKHAPIRTKLYNENSFKGKKTIVKGKVYGSDCKTVLSNAVIDVWHANPVGEYDIHSDEFNFRGQVTTNEDGQYIFETLMPAPYIDGGLNRPAHIHYKVRAEGYTELTTQLYFTGDERLKNDIFVRRNNGMKRVRRVLETNNYSEIYFDVYL